MFCQWKSSSSMRSQIPSNAVESLGFTTSLLDGVCSTSFNSTFNIMKCITHSTSPRVLIQWILVCVSWLSPSSSSMRSQIPSNVVESLGFTTSLLDGVCSTSFNSTFNIMKCITHSTSPRVLIQWILVCVSWLSPWSLHLWTRGEVHKLNQSVVAEPNDPPAAVHDSKSCRC